MTVRSDFRAVLRVGDIEFECQSFTATYALNKIPLATVTPALGRGVMSNKISKVHTHLDALVEHRPCQVILRPLGDFARAGDRAWSKAGAQILFDGYVQGPGFRGNRKSLSFTLNMIHWLSDLAFSSSLSNQSHPANPAYYGWRASYPSGPTTTGNRPTIQGTARFQSHLQLGKIAEDLWGQALQPLLCELSEEDPIALGPLKDCGGNPDVQENIQALSALSRFEGGGCSQVENRWSKPLDLASLGTIGNEVARAVSRAVGRQMLESWWGVTLWHKLIGEFSPAFMFHVVPRPSTCLIVPFTPGLRESWQVEIDANDVEECYIGSFVRRPLRGVGIFAGREFRTAASNPAGNAPTADIGVGGCYMPDPQSRGQLMLLRAPEWLAAVPAHVLEADRTIMGAAPADNPTLAPVSRQPTSSATTPLEEDNEGLRNRNPDDVMRESANIYDNLARAIYIHEVLRGRGGKLVTKFRCDIAPGSTIKLTNLGSLLTDDDDVPLFSSVMYATVTSVQLVLSAEPPAAYTVLELAHLRTEVENESDLTSVEKHPLYTGGQFTGAPLVDPYLFDGESREEQGYNLSKATKEQEEAGAPPIDDEPEPPIVAPPSANDPVPTNPILGPLDDDNPIFGPLN